VKGLKCEQSKARPVRPGFVLHGLLARAGAGPHAEPGGVESVEELEDGALIGGGEVGDLLEALEEAGALGGALLGARLEAEQAALNWVRKQAGE